MDSEAGVCSIPPAPPANLRRRCLTPSLSHRAVTVPRWLDRAASVTSPSESEASGCTGNLNRCSESFLCDSKVISRALLRIVAVCNWLLPVCRPLFSGANQCELSARPQRERRKRRSLHRPLRALELLGMGLGSHGRVRRRYAAPSNSKFRRTESISVLLLEWEAKKGKSKFNRNQN